MRQLITFDIILLGDGRFLCCCCYSILLGIEILFPIQKKHSEEKKFFWVFVTAWIQKWRCLRWTTCTLMVDLLFMVIHTWTVCYVTLKCFAHMQFCTMLLVLCIQRCGKDRVIAIWLDVDQTRVCLAISQYFNFVSVWSFLYLPYSTDSTVDQKTLTWDTDNVCRKTFLTTYFDKLWFCKFVFIYPSIFLYV